MDGKRGPSQSAPYGQACLPCFKAKCRCIRPDGNKCERCRRLNTQCLPADSVRKARNSQKNQDSNVRIAQLEGKLDTVVSLLQSVSNSHESSEALRKIFDQSGIANTSVSLAGAAATPTSLLSSAAINSSSSCSPASAQAPHAEQRGAPVFSHEASVEEAQTCLVNFCSYLLPSLPFIHLPPHVTAEQLRQERPFLVRAIVAVSSTSVQHKLERGKELKRLLALEYVAENRSNLDLLLSLLTYVAWGSEQFLTKTDTLSRLMMMAISMVCDLGFNKPLPPDEHMIGQFVPDFQCPIRVTRPDTGQPLLEGQRATLACFLLSSIVSSYFTQIDAMRWTSRMEEHLGAIMANKDCPTDETFAFLVRLQLVAQETVRAREQLESNQANGTTVLPLSLLFDPLQKQLQDLKTSVPPHLPSHEMLMLHAHYVELCISETSHTANSNAPVLSTTTIGPMGSGTPSFQRLACLWRSVNAIKSWLDVFFSLPSLICRNLSFLFSAQMARCLVTLIRLSILDDPSWDRTAVSNIVDLRLVLDSMAQKLSSSDAGLAVEDDLFAQFPRMTRILRAWLGPKMAPEEPEDEGSDWPNVQSDGMDPDQVMPWTIDVGNDEWLSAFLAGVA